MTTVATIRIPTARQGQTGMGQGGHACHAMQSAIGEPVTVALRSAIPLETDLHVLADDASWRLVDPAAPDVTILEATRWDPRWPDTDPVSVADAERARADANLDGPDHPAPHCISCGTGPQSLRVHAGALGDGRWASPLRFPAWSLIDGRVDESLLWMAIDCACGWYTSRSGQSAGRGLTVQFAVEVAAPLQPDADYVVVAWNGEHIADWDGRKRGAAAAVFDEHGTRVASSTSFWVRPRS